jgi:pimeloyl-ACP methyl ester carboxylesterase
MTSQRTESTGPDTIVLIHGFWVTPRSWEHWISHYQERGYQVLAPAYPGFEVGVEALNSDPSPIEALTVPAIIEHLESVISGVQRPPIALNSAPTEGVAVAPLSQVKASFPVLRNPANHHKAVALTPAQWHYAFANTFTDEESLALYERYAIPASGRIFWDSALATLQPGHQDTYVDYRNDARAPLLFISGGEDHLMPPKVQQSNARHYKSNTITEIREYAGRAHLLPAQPGWEEIADYALEWAVSAQEWAVSHAQGAAARTSASSA